MKNGVSATATTFPGNARFEETEDDGDAWVGAWVQKGVIFLDTEITVIHSR